MYRVWQPVQTRIYLGPIKFFRNQLLVLDSDEISKLVDGMEKEVTTIRKEVLKFFDWAYKNGAGMATDLDYVPMPASTVKLIQEGWKAQIKDASGKSVW